MKRLHRDDLYGWSRFDPDRNIDFHSVVWIRDGGNVAIDPLPMTEHDRGHLESLGGLAAIVVTNSDHLRDAVALAASTGAELCGPAAEPELPCSRWIADGDEIVAGLRALALDGSKTPGELALVLEVTTLITGDLIRVHQAGRLCLLPAPKLSDPTAARRSIERLVALPAIDAILVGDGWPIFRGGARALADLQRDV
jgi:hypothetical protein